MRSAANCKQGYKLFVNLLRISTTLFLFVTSKDLKKSLFLFNLLLYIQNDDF
jgi:hypothetical protein